MPTDFTRQTPPNRPAPDAPNPESIPSGGPLPFGQHTDPKGEDIGVGSIGNPEKPYRLGGGGAQ